MNDNPISASQRRTWRGETRRSLEKVEKRERREERKRESREYCPGVCSGV